MKHQLSLLVRTNFVYFFPFRLKEKQNFGAVMPESVLQSSPKKRMKKKYLLVTVC